jgi:hypothetical protein
MNFIVTYVCLIDCKHNDSNMYGGTCRIAPRVYVASVGAGGGLVRTPNTADFKGRESEYFN